MRGTMRLSKVPLRQAQRTQHRAMSRLTLRVMGEIHRILYPVQAWIVERILSNAGPDGAVAPEAVMRLSGELEQQWRPALRKVAQVIEAGRREAANMAGGGRGRPHKAMTTAAEQARREAGAGPRMTPDDVASVIRLWQQRRDAALRAASLRTQGDGLVLSQRIWNLENGGLARIRATLSTAMQERTNAQALANLVEAELGAGRDIPRWTEDRLYRMTPSERAASSEGLLRGPEGRGQGISYNALRLARTEIQYANHAVASEIAAHNPAVTGRKVRLSPGHPQIDICDEYASGGPYDKMQQILPLHPQCMCYYEDVLMSRKEFTAGVKGWVSNENQFLDDYAAWLGTRQPTDLMPWTMSLAESLNLWLRMGRENHAAALYAGA